MFSYHFFLALSLSSSYLCTYRKGKSLPSESMLMEQKKSVCDGSAPVLRLQPRHIIPSLPPDGGRGNAGSSFEDYKSPPRRPRIFMM